MSRTWWIIVAVVAVAVGLAVVIGIYAVHANSANRAANDAYANSVCGAVASWQQQLKTIGSSGGTSKADLESQASQVETATDNLVKQIGAVPLPRSSDGQAAKQQLNQLTTDLSNTVTATKNGIATIQDNTSVATIATVINALGPQYQNLISSAKTAIHSLGDNAVPLGLAFRRSDTCQSL